MIAYLKGVNKYSGSDYIIIEVNGIGYKVFMPASALYKVPPVEEQVTAYTHMYVREDAIQLYGFLDQEELELFEILLQVSGIGPKVAVAILSAIPAPSFKQAVVNEEIGILTKIPGIGKKTAQRMILELKDKLSKLPVDENSPTTLTPTSAPNQDEAVEALVALGYGTAEAKKTVNKIINFSPNLDIEAIIKKALTEMSKI